MCGRRHGGEGYKGRCNGPHCPRRGGGKTTELDINDAPTFEDGETSINGVKLDRVKSRPQQHKQQHLLCPKPPLCRGSN